MPNWLALVGQMSAPDEERLLERRFSLLLRTWGPVAALRVPPDAVLRHFDDTSGIVYFRGKEYPLLPLLDAIRTLRECAQAAMFPRTKP